MSIYFRVSKTLDIRYLKKCFCDCISSSFFNKVNPSFVAQFEEKGLNFVGTDVDGQRMEIVELKGNNNNNNIHIYIG